MKCKDIMNTNLEWLSEQDTVKKAATVMAEAGVGFLPICDARRMAVGVVTDRDLVTRGIARGVSPAEGKIVSLMTSPVVTCRAGADIGEAEDLMAGERKSRLVITNDDGTFAGVLSIADLIEHAPQRGAIHALKTLLMREALGPRAGAEKGAPLLKDDPRAGVKPPPGTDLPHSDGSVFQGGHHEPIVKVFPS
jgi:CBS domain-containing protein